MAQENTHDQKMAELAKHKEGHITYWKAHNGQTDPKRFEDGFIQGWFDAENKSLPNITRDSMLAQRKGENIAYCGNSPHIWAFEHGYHEGFDARRCLAPKPAPPAQENTHDQKMAELAKHKDGHIAYWKGQNKPTDPKRFEDGFIQGWCDAENKSFPNINRDSMLAQRKGENIAHCGNSPHIWAFEHGYHEGFDARRCLAPKPAPPQENTHDQKMAELCKHKDAHIAYWKAHGNKPTDPKRFEDGFIQGWCDCEHHLADNNMNANSLIGQRRQEHVKSHGDSPCEWAFEDGYREGWNGRKCMKPPQTPTPPPAQPPKVSDCPPTEAPKPTATPVPAPPVTPQPPAPQQPPKAADCPPAEATPKPTCAPVPPAPPPATKPPADSHCHTPAADLPANHQCTSECNHGKKEGLLEKIEHALHIN